MEKGYVGVAPVNRCRCGDVQWCDPASFETWSGSFGNLFTKEVVWYCEDGQVYYRPLKRNKDAVS